MINRQCATCLFWLLTDEAEEWKFGQCRRHSPKLEGRDTKWPTTEATDWCGEWEPVDSEGSKGLAND